MKKRDLEEGPFEVNILKMPGAAETLLTVLTEGGVTPAALLECLHYASDQGLFELMRTAAALDATERAKVIACAKSLQGEDLPMRLLLQLPDAVREAGEGQPEEFDAVSGERN